MNKNGAKTKWAQTKIKRTSVYTDLSRRRSATSFIVSSGIELRA